MSFYRYSFQAAVKIYTRFSGKFISSQSSISPTFSVAIFPWIQLKADTRLCGKRFWFPEFFQCSEVSWEISKAALFQ